MGNGGQKIRSFLIAALAMCGQGALAEDACDIGVAELRGDWGQAQFNVEIADDPNERSRGLQNRASMPRSAGMLFIYNRPRTVRFWMSETLIPLDMIFLDGRGVVQKVHHEAQPLDETLVFGGNNIQYVLEINGGLADRIGIGEGTQLRHASLMQDNVAWRCPD